MNIGVIITAVVTVVGSISALVEMIIKYKNAKKTATNSTKKEFYLATAYNIVIEAENMFGDDHGEEKKQYAMTRLQNEANSSGIEWDSALASTCIEKSVALRNDYKNGKDVNIEEVIKVETEADQEALETAKKELTETAKSTVSTVVEQAKEVKEEVIKVIEE